MDINGGLGCVKNNLHDIQQSDPPPPHLGKTSLLEYAKDLELEINKLDEKPIIIGHTAGVKFNNTRKPRV
jgi:hypothetical protein